MTTKRTKPTHAVMFRVNGKSAARYFIEVMRTRGNPVLAFPSRDDGLAHFEDAYFAAMDRGAGFTGGAILHYIKLNPRIFEFGERRVLERLVGNTPKFVSLSDGLAVPCEYAYECRDRRYAERLYEHAATPRLTRYA